jgi:L-alanine-DL-glutamate epimerase-like enolase superfamily enzyme
MNAPADLAEELVALGYKGMKLWSFDAVYRRQGGHYLSRDDIREGVAPFEAIRERVGDKIEVMLDGHGFFSLAAARRIAEGMKDVRPMWMEDILRPDSIHAMAAFRAEIQVPVAVSEMLIMADHYRQVLDARAADYVMIDPTWVGGISATRRIAELAQLYNVPTLMHDCTGPFTLLSGLTVAAANSGVAFQETVRAHIATLYPSLIDETIKVHNGQIPISHRPGIGARWIPEIFDVSHPGYRRSSL